MKMQTSVGCGINYGFFQHLEPGPSKNWGYLFSLILIGWGCLASPTFFFLQ
jgi:hypothetical protein